MLIALLTYTPLRVCRKAKSASKEGEARWALPVSGGFRVYDTPPVRARQLLTEAGWQIHDAVLVDVEGQSFETEFL